jgi:hypothetical protein
MNAKERGCEKESHRSYLLSPGPRPAAVALQCLHIEYGYEYESDKEDPAAASAALDSHTNLSKMQCKVKAGRSIMRKKRGRFCFRGNKLQEAISKWLSVYKGRAILK